MQLFYSYSHKDESLRDELETHLTMLRREGVINEWHDRRITASDSWKDRIDKNLESPDIVLLLVSPNSLKSDYCYGIETLYAIERHWLGEARVVPFILRPCEWQATPFAKLQLLPKDGKPITTWDNPDEAFFDVTKGLRRDIDELTDQRSLTVLRLPNAAAPPALAFQYILYRDTTDKPPNFHVIHVRLIRLQFISRSITHPKLPQRIIQYPKPSPHRRYSCQRLAIRNPAVA